MSPYPSTVAEFVTHFGTSDNRKQILSGWIKHRQELRKIGIRKGMQWLDGSFVEDKEPHDLDVVSFSYRPSGKRRTATFHGFATSHINLLFDRPQIKATDMLDFLFVDLDMSSEGLVAATAYWLHLFSHQRSTFSWKGIVQVRLEDELDETRLLSTILLPVTGSTP
ncbi:MAG: hypothetical protein M3Y56_04165 [Armatimonadota bacterium]|nr:hypothetical protein [Armatimonadota bacterium]